MNKSQWKISDIFIGIFVIAFVVALLVAAILPTWLAPGGRPHGNRAAILECRNYFFIISHAETNSSEFDFSKLSKEDEIELIHLGYLAKTNFIWGNSSNRESVIVCQNQFSDVPRTGFLHLFLPNPAHAVGYSDGAAGLISPKEFSQLNLNGFISLSSLATNSEFNISKP
jgi:hypothetical protein